MFRLRSKKTCRLSDMHNQFAESLFFKEKDAVCILTQSLLCHTFFYSSYVTFLACCNKPKVGYHGDPSWFGFNECGAIFLNIVWLGCSFNASVWFIFEVLLLFLLSRFTLFIGVCG